MSPLTGVLVLVGGFMILLGYKSQVVAWLLLMFLVSTTSMTHRFWGLSVPTGYERVKLAAAVQ